MISQQELQAARSINPRIIHISVALGACQAHQDEIDYGLRAPARLWQGIRDSLSELLAEEHPEYGDMFGEVLDALRNEHENGGAAPVNQPTPAAQTAPEASKPAVKASKPAADPAEAEREAERRAAAQAEAARAQAEKAERAQRLEGTSRHIKALYDTGWTPTELSARLGELGTPVEAKQLARLVKLKDVPELDAARVEEALSQIGKPAPGEDDPANPESPWHARMRELAAQLGELAELGDVEEELEKTKARHAHHAPAIGRLSSHATRQLLAGETSENGAWLVKPSDVAALGSAIKDTVGYLEANRDGSREGQIRRIEQHFERNKPFKTAEVQQLLGIDRPAAMALVKDIKGRSFLGSDTWIIKD